MKSCSFAALLLGVLACLINVQQVYAQVENWQIPEHEMAALYDNYRGAWWTTLKDTCTYTQFKVVAAAIKLADEQLFNEADTTRGRVYTPAWNRFFIRPFEPGVKKDWLSADDHRNRFIDIQNNMDLVARWLVKGDSANGEDHKAKRRIMYTCEVFHPWQCGPGVAAETMTPVASEYEVWTTVFCPYFFTGGGGLKFLSGHANRDPPNVPGDFTDTYSFEHVIAHELFHVDLIRPGSSTQHITDQVTDYYDGRGAVGVYGAEQCFDYAWKYEGSVNFDVAANADSYAWYFTNRYFAKKWNWGVEDDGLGIVNRVNPPKTLGEAGDSTSALHGELESVTVPSSEPFKLPSNCQMIHSTETPGEELEWFCSHVAHYVTFDWATDTGEFIPTDRGCGLS